MIRGKRNNKLQAEGEETYKLCSFERREQIETNS